jgi:hypothetical protein
MPYRDLDPTPAEKTVIPNAPENEVEPPQRQALPGNRWAGLGGPPADAGNALRRATNGRLSRAGGALLHLENQYGNRYVQQLINPQQRLTVQPKLMLGDVDTPSEQEAEQASRAISRGRPLSVPPTPVNGPVTPVTAQTESAIDQARGGGQPLPESTQTQMSQALGADLSGVRVHTDRRADSLNQSLQAKAFATGQDIFFRRGTYSPGSSGGQQLLAHELTHVAQQGGNGVIQRKIYASSKVGKKEISPKAAYEHLLSVGIPNHIASALTKWYGRPNENITLGDLVSMAKGAAVREASNIKAGAHRPRFRQEALWEEMGTMPKSSPAKSPKIAQWIPPSAASVPPASGGTEEEAFGRGKDKDEWQPIKMGIHLFSKEDKSEPDVQITQQVVRNDEIDTYISPQRQQEILAKVAKQHGTDGPIKPAYWVKDARAGGPWEAITEQGLRPMIIPESFPSALGTKNVPEVVYRGSGLSPMQVLLYDGFRAWGTDVDLYHHTDTEQTERRHSGYVATSGVLDKAIKFADDAAGDDGYVYEIDLKGLFRIEVGPFTRYPDEKEWVVPYQIPMKNVRRVFSLRTKKWSDFSKTKNDLNRFKENFNLFSAQSLETYGKQVEEESKGFDEDFKQFESMEEDITGDFTQLGKQASQAMDKKMHPYNLVAHKDQVIGEDELKRLLRNENDVKVRSRVWYKKLTSNEEQKPNIVGFSVGAYLVKKGYIGVTIGGELFDLQGSASNWKKPLGIKLNMINW